MIILGEPHILRPRQEFKNFVLVNDHILATVIHHLQDSLGIDTIVSRKLTCLVTTQSHQYGFAVFIALRRTNNLCECALDITLYVAVVLIE